MSKKCMKHAKKISLLIALCVIWISDISVLASDAEVACVLVYEENIYVFIRGIPDVLSDSSVQIGNQACSLDDISVAKLTALTPPMRTLILIDNSRSIPSDERQNISEIVQGVISGALEGEEIRIGIFSDTLTWLCEYTDDTDALTGIIDSISYKNQDTYLSDILYDVIKDLNSEQDSTYTRIIIFSDGADDKAIGYTNDEVRSLISESPYPVYTVGVPGNGNDSELETMFSFSRASSAYSYILDGSLSNVEIAEGLLEDQGIICLRIVPDESLKDGSVKNILLTLSTSEGTVELTAGVTMPFALADAQETEITGEEEADEAELDEEEETEETLPTITIGGEEEETKSSFNAAITAAVAAAFAAAAVTVILLLRKKKKAAENESSTPEEPFPVPREKEFDIGEQGATIFEGASIEHGQTVGLWAARKRAASISLTDTSLPSSQYKSPIESSVRIGRSCVADIVITGDPRVSREHCEIILRGELLYVKDLGSKNGTYYEGVMVHGEAPMVSGGRLKVGGHTYRVDLLRE